MYVNLYACFFKSKINKLCDNVSVVLNGYNIDFVHATKYLGLIINSSMFNSTSSSIKKLKISYNSALRILLLIKKYYSASTMFITHGIPSF